ncbi:MAG: hypothetical protein EOO40_08105 [Deltaproteobacteria bacterium]|nr:MAG: hypothetical protein EOO40_08105 [Deltaproteobacteria bacterium]
MSVLAPVRGFRVSRVLKKPRLTGVCDPAAPPSEPDTPEMARARSFLDSLRSNDGTALAFVIRRQETMPGGVAVNATALVGSAGELGDCTPSPP